jgi:hypothetical protein
MKIKLFEDYNEDDNYGKFKLIKPIGEFKKGKTFDSYDGLVMGIVIEVDGKKTTLNFNDTNYFTPK